MKTFLVATDFSQSALNAAKYAAAFGSQLGISQIILYHSFDALHSYFDLTQIRSTLSDSDVEDGVGMILKVVLIQYIVLVVSTLRPVIRFTYRP